MTFPVIRLEVEGMRHTIKVALSEYAARMDADIQAAVDAYCDPKNIRAVVDDIASKEIKAAIQGEVERYFRSGFGRAAIREAVERSFPQEPR